MMEEIINSRLTPAEKLFLIAEWILRDHLPYELQDVSLSDVLDEIKSFVVKQLPQDFLEDALKEVRSLLHIENDNSILLMIVGLAYYSYIDSEVLYDHETRSKMMSKVSELGFRLSEIEQLYEKWAHIIGDSATLFNKMFEK